MVCVKKQSEINAVCREGQGGSKECLNTELEMNPLSCTLPFKEAFDEI